MQILKKNKRMIIGITIAVVIAVLLSTISCYVLAESLINSKDVGYEDNSNLAADNVQDAIDGTCTKIDTRLSGIEDNLYTIKNMYKYTRVVTSTSLAYTGVSIDFSANSMCSITVSAGWGNSSPAIVALGRTNSTINASNTVDIDYGDQHGFGRVALTVAQNFTEAATYYVWAQYSGASENGIVVNGFCATKYK